ncbi:MAG TPA: FHA domain-containing protein [Hyphomicrobium sp.]|nr:FHA domain-containing protein [Hyphomicrobium sp.]
MRRPARQREAIAAIGMLLSVLGSFGAAAAQTKLISKCQPPAQKAAAATLICDVRANGFAVFNGVKASIKGGSGDLDAKFEDFDPAARGSTTAFLIQLMSSSRRTTLAQMGDAVVTLTDARGGKRRFAAYTFANDLTLVSDSGASKNEFVRKLISVKPAAATIQLYKSALQAIDALKKEAGDRKALVILGDGSSDDTGYTHDQVVKAARDAGVTIHVLGYYDDRTERPKFQKLSRLAEDTGGYAAEVKQGSSKDLTKDVVTSRFAPEVLENGGSLTATLKGPAGAQTIELSADLADGQALKAEEKVDVPAPPQPTFDTTVNRAEPPPEPAGTMDWLADYWIAALGALLGFAAVGFLAYRRGLIGGAPPAEEQTATHQAAEADLLRDADGQPVIYGWLETLDDGAARHPLRTTNVRVGRHRDNDICLQNDSISRRHAVLHYNAETKRFVITDLGGGNGVVVNKTKYKTHELNDGDMVELGDVRLRFRAESEFMA